MTLSDALSRICPGNIQTAQAARQRFSDLAILPGSLGLLEDTVVRLAALQGSTQPLSSPKRTVIFCADNGVTAEGVTPSPSYMTAAQAVNFARGGGVINVFSRRAEAPVLVVDVGIAVPYWEPRIRAAFVRKGTDNIVRGPAMTREECLHTLETGISLAAEAAADGIRVAIPGKWASAIPPPPEQWHRFCWGFLRKNWFRTAPPARQEPPIRRRSSAVRWRSTAPIPPILWIS